MAIKDRYLSAKGFNFGKQQSGKVYRAVVEATNACNLACTMCPRNDMKRPVKHMDQDLFESIIMQNKDSLEFVNLNGYGEPLLHPKIFDFLNFARKHGVGTGISTNVTMLTEEKSAKLLANPADVVILAIDGASAETYEKVRVGAKFDPVIENAKRFMAMRKKSQKKPYVILQCIYMTETKNQIEDFHSLFAGCNYDAIRIRQLTFSGKNRADDNYKNCEGSCYWLWTEPMILSDGTLVPCCQDVDGALVLGNVKEKSLNELWRDGYIKELREKHASGKRSEIDFCKSCNMYQPNKLLSWGSSLLNTSHTNVVLPTVETFLSRMRYKNLNMKFNHSSVKNTKSTCHE